MICLTLVENPFLSSVQSPGTSYIFSQREVPYKKTANTFQLHEQPARLPHIVRGTLGPSKLDGRHIHIKDRQSIDVFT